MGGIWFKRAELVGATSDTVGYKAGLALCREELAAHTEGMDIEHWWFGDDDQIVRVRSEEFEEAIEQLLYAVGNIPVARVMRPDISLFHKYRSDPDWFRVLLGVLDILKALPVEEDKPVDLTPLLERSQEQFGVMGAAISLEYLDGLQLYLHANPWGNVRRKQWSDVTELKALFESADLSTQYGEFVDQRYLDYLAANFERIDEIHWRKFEGVTAEWFTREGWRVEIGPGGNDGGVDVRVWSDGAALDTPPAILIQCKRQKDKVGKVVVKALWADVIHEKATSGLVVTTSCLSPGAAKVCSARQYPVRQLDRQGLQTWIQLMRTPGTGAFLGE